MDSQAEEQGVVEKVLGRARAQRRAQQMHRAAFQHIAEVFSVDWKARPRRGGGGKRALMWVSTTSARSLRPFPLVLACVTEAGSGAAGRS